MLFLTLVSFTAAVITGIYAYHTSQKNIQILRSTEELQRSFKHDRANLENQTAQSSQILHHLSEGVIGVDSRQRILFMNPSAASILRLDGKSCLDKTLLEVTHHTAVEETMNQAMKRQSHETGEIALTYPEEKTLRFNAIGLPAEAGKMRGIITFYDVTKVKNLENMRREFVANVSHELKTPLTSIHGFIETLLGGALKDTAQSETFLKMMREDTERLNRLIHNLLELSRIESREYSLKTEKLSLKHEVERALSILAPRLEEKKIRVDTQVAEDLPSVLADRDQLKQVLLNLLENAVKFNHEGGKIKVTAAKKGSFVETCVQDTGCGIPKDSVNRVFERFFRVDKSRTSSSGGTGLGLSIVKHIVEAHGGQVRCESAPNKGASFFFTLRVA